MIVQTHGVRRQLLSHHCLHSDVFVPCEATTHPPFCLKMECVQSQYGFSLPLLESNNKKESKQTNQSAINLKFKHKHIFCKCVSRIFTRSLINYLLNQSPRPLHSTRIYFILSFYCNVFITFFFSSWLKCF